MIPYIENVQKEEIVVEGVEKMLLDGTMEIAPQLCKFTPKFTQWNHPLKTREC